MFRGRLSLIEDGHEEICSADARCDCGEVGSKVTNGSIKSMAANAQGIIEGLQSTFDGTGGFIDPWQMWGNFSYVPRVQ